MAAASSVWNIIRGEMIMRTGILVLAMAIFSGSAWSAEWILIKDDAKSGEKTYIDKNTLGRAETLAIMWSLVNHQKPKGVARRAHLSDKWTTIINLTSCVFDAHHLG